MKIEVTTAFFGRPKETDEDNTQFLAGAVVDVPDEWAKMVIEKGLAKAASPEPPAEKVESYETE